MMKILLLLIVLIVLIVFVSSLKLPSSSSSSSSSLRSLKSSSSKLLTSTSTSLYSSKANAVVVDPVATGESLKNVPTGGSVVLRCDGLTKSYTGQPQLDNVALCICKGQRIGLVGGNGAGKSTFLKMLAKVMSPDSGTIEISSSANTVFVEQEPDWGDILVYEGLFEGNTPEAIATRKYFKALEVMDDNMLGDATNAVEEANAWDYQADGLSIADKLNIKSERMNARMNSLSGGEKKRVSLAAALLKKPDILLLDEPTNHLDLEAMEWLSDYLKPGGRDKDMAMLLVTHDRYFLERVCSEIIEIDRASLYRYPGNYMRFLELKAARIAAEDADAERARTKLRKESEWMAKQPRARQAKSKARQDQFYELVERAKGRGPDAKALSLVSDEEKERQKRLGGVVAEFKGAKYMMGDKVLLDDFTYNFRSRDRIGVVGANGVGKSTFLKILTNQLPLLKGSVRIGETVCIGYYEQTGLNLTAEQEKQPVLKFVQEAVEKFAPTETLKTPALKMQVDVNEPTGRRKLLAGKEATVNVQVTQDISQSSAVSERDAMALLSRFQFPSKRWYDRVGQLSGGERRRLQLLQILARRPNVLLLDEPSNDLDLNTISVLEEYLTDTFEGCLIVVSHDNFFVNRVAEHLFVFEGDGIVRDFQGSYTEYVQYRLDVAQEKRDAANEAAKAKKSSSATTTTTSPTKKKVQDIESDEITTKDSISSSVKASTATTTTKASSSPSTAMNYNERKEYNKIEKEIQKLGKEIKEYEDKLTNSNGKEGYSQLAEWTKKLNDLKSQCEKKEMRWLELAALDA